MRPRGVSSWTTGCSALDSAREDLVIHEDRVQARRMLSRQGCEKRRSKQQVLHAKACLQPLRKVPGSEPLRVFLLSSATPQGQPSHEVANLRPIRLRLAQLRWKVALLYPAGILRRAQPVPVERHQRVLLQEGRGGLLVSARLALVCCASKHGLSTSHAHRSLRRTRGVRTRRRRSPCTPPRRGTPCAPRRSSFRAQARSSWHRDSSAGSGTACPCRCRRVIAPTTHSPHGTLILPRRATCRDRYNR
mmetsp:Transcript_28271/g.71784  ORF Transcript_28271/g.71784 Transcript_28271/m.71784 type:complete len:247 (+) Transcript_28271:563-1303(+)